MEKVEHQDRCPEMVISSLCHREICGPRAQTRLDDTCCQAASRQPRIQLCFELAFQHYKSYSALIAFMEMEESKGRCHLILK